MNNLLELFGDNLLPIFLAAGAGYLASKYLRLEARSLSQISFYIFSPCLIFRLLVTSQLVTGDIARMVGFTILSVLSVGAIAWIVGSLLQLERRMLAALVLVSTFGNAGNFGLSLNLFAFGETTLAYASLYFVALAVMMYTLGVIIASLGSSGFKQSLLGLLKVPVVYAVALALLFNRFHWALPVPLDRSVTLMADAAIPALLVLMGVQIQHAKFDGQLRELTLANLMKLVVGPTVGFLFALLLNLRGFALQAGITQAAAPTAVIMTILASEYDVHPSFVTTAVLSSTLISPLTITPILALLGA